MLRARGACKARFFFHGSISFAKTVPTMYIKLKSVHTLPLQIFARCGRTVRVKRDIFSHCFLFAETVPTSYCTPKIINGAPCLVLLEWFTITGTEFGNPANTFQKCVFQIDKKMNSTIKMKKRRAHPIHSLKTKKALLRQSSVAKWNLEHAFLWKDVVTTIWKLRPVSYERYLRDFHIFFCRDGKRWHNFHLRMT